MNYTAALLAFALLLASCQKEVSSEQQTEAPPEIVPEIQTNRLADEPSAFLLHSADSKINWQPWSPDVLDYAKKAQRIVMVVVGSARYNGCLETLDALDRFPALVNRINQNYIPVLTDLDLTRETGLLSYNLSSESRTSVSFPFLLFLSPDGNPITWHPINYQSDREVHQFFDSSFGVIGRLWSDSPDYVSVDSDLKATLRRENLPAPDEDVPETAERQRRYEAAMRRLGSFYDEDITSMSGSGGLFPFGIFDTFTLASQDPSLSEFEREKYRKILDAFTSKLLGSAMIDILDGGVHSARRGSSWNIVMSRRDCSTQARAARIFARMHQIDGRQGTLDAAIGAVRFAEDRFLTPGGLFSLNEKPEVSTTKQWLWTIDQVSSVLSDDEFKVWKSYSKLGDIGNLPSEADPNRNFFRLNSLSAARTPEEVSRLTSIELPQVQSLIASGRKKLHKARESRMPDMATDPTPSALASFRMVSAYASLYAATGDADWLEKALSLGKSAREQFLGNLFLNERPDGQPEGSSDGRAFSYAIAVQAGLDLGAVTIEDEWYSWAQDLTTLLAEHFVTEDGRLMEARKISQVVTIDYEDRLMVFDNSTAGQVRLNIQRLRALGYQTPPSLSAWLTSLPGIENFPIIFTDSMIAMSHEWNHTLIKVGKDTPENLTTAIRTLPIQVIARRRGDHDGVKVIAPDGSETIVTQPDEIKNLLKKP
ncbi:DUF255 domain-containing protein [Haloferula sp.]|uniref:DUF255 domain-containing protein n=1 Tax=Haloferula sp. TaxID=2497595 RepID=UPI00329BBFD5